MRAIILLCFAIMISGCATAQIITMPNGEVYNAKVSSGTLVEITEEKIIIDRTGKPSVFEDIFKFFALIKIPNLN